jgi:hypothetical protein
MIDPLPELASADRFEMELLGWLIIKPQATL